MQIRELGWDDVFANAFQAYGKQGCVPARVTREDRDRYRIRTETGERAAVCSGRLRHEATERAARPAVGDWVAVDDAAGTTTIRGILPRRSEFQRKQPGAASLTQVLAANVDVAFIVTGLDGNFSLRRIERYLTLTATSGARPVLLLNKADLCPGLELRIRQAEGVASGAPVLAISAATGKGVGHLPGHLGFGRTGVFLGSSGVGKTTLVNRLVGEELGPTHEIRQADSKGRHTTTWRELIVLPEMRGVVIDTPGLREIQLPGVEGIGASFADVESLAGTCRFRDCRHEDEPGCAVHDALREGRLDPDRFESYLEQRREAAYQERRVDDRARRAHEDRWRRITMEYRRRMKGRPEGR